LTTETFEALGLAEPLLRALKGAGYQTPTPIQARTIPHLLAGRDVLGLAQTGTGKTAAFALPLMQRLAEKRGRPAPKTCRALILAPTRELAVQIGQGLRTYGRHLHLRHTVVVGGVGMGPQIRAVGPGVDILVATPGRLLDLIDQGKLSLDRVETLVLDEADRMLDMGFIRDIRRIVGMIPHDRHALMFSATMAKPIELLAREILSTPEHVAVAPEQIAVDRIEQGVHFVAQRDKRDLLKRLLDDPAMSRVIVFTRTKHRADRVADQLAKDGVPAEALHGNKSQNARQRALDRFKGGRARVLVATDIAARGIDVADVSHVVNFELPNEPESYVHRIGRTARAGASGIAVSLCDPEEHAYLRDIERLIARELDLLGGERPRHVPAGKPKAKGRGRPQGGGPQARGGGKPGMGKPVADGAKKSGPRRRRGGEAPRRRAA
jgi:ATP-dependent RNA helicase RhlE